jgi:hypothetical protein
MKYDSEAQEVLDYLAVDQCWQSGSSGDVEAPTGYFASLSLPDYESARAGWFDWFDIEHVFLEYENESEDVVADMVGHWLIIHDEQGFVHFSKFDTEEELAAAFTENDEAYSEWLDGFENEYSVESYPVSYNPVTGQWDSIAYF